MKHDDDWVGIGFASESPATIATNLERPWWTDEVADEEPWLPMAPGKLVARDMEYEGKGKLRNKGVLDRARVLFHSSDQLVLRADVADAVFGKLPESEVTLHPVELVDARGSLGNDFRAVEIHQRHPLDRDAAKATYFGNTKPHAGMPRHVSKVAFGEDRAPQASIVRLGEFPTVMCAKGSIVAQLSDLTRGAIVEVLSGTKSKAAEDVVIDGFIRYYDQKPPPLPNAGAAAGAAAAFWQAYSGSEIDREKICASPHYAFWFAALIDGASDDTRRAACAHPYYAVVYARDVDGGPRDDTRVSACAHPYAAANYARDVDRGPHQRTRAAVDGQTYEAALAVAEAIDAWAAKHKLHSSARTKPRSRPATPKKNGKKAGKNPKDGPRRRPPATAP